VNPPTPLRVGVSYGGAGDVASFARLLARAEAAEGLGLHSVWLPEGHFRRGAMASPLLVLAAIAARTRRIALGTTSLLLPVQHPLRLANEVAALDVLSGGRVLLGLGRGFAPALFDAFGFAPAEKRDRFDEALDAILRAFEGGELSLAGAHFATYDGRSVRPALRPAQRPHPPLFVAAFGRKGLLQAARRGLPYLASPLEPLDVLAENYAIHREHAPGGVVTGPFRVPVMRTVHVAGSDEEAARALATLEDEARGSARLLPPAIARATAGPASSRAIVGTAAAVVDGLARYRERLGMDLLVVRSEIAGVDEAERQASLGRLVHEVLPAL
jgi:alkanesulfonate monooxygenase SsuD/methylene tetrahydromethanopterin reductase-like flavin-dependent oxidoreductase (luciferase family)